MRISPRRGRPRRLLRLAARLAARHAARPRQARGRVACARPGRASCVVLSALRPSATHSTPTPPRRRPRARFYFQTTQSNMTSLRAVLCILALGIANVAAFAPASQGGRVQTRRMMNNNDLYGPPGSPDAVLSQGQNVRLVLPTIPATRPRSLRVCSELRRCRRRRRCRFPPLPAATAAPLWPLPSAVVLARPRPQASATEASVASARRPLID